MKSTSLSITVPERHTLHTRSILRIKSVVPTHHTQTQHNTTEHIQWQHCNWLHPSSCVFFGSHHASCHCLHSSPFSFLLLLLLLILRFFTLFFCLRCWNEWMNEQQCPISRAAARWTTSSPTPPPSLASVSGWCLACVSAPPSSSSSSSYPSGWPSSAPKPTPFPSPMSPRRSKKSGSTTPPSPTRPTNPTLFRNLTQFRLPRKKPTPSATTESSSRLGRTTEFPTPNVPCFAHLPTTLPVLRLASSIRFPLSFPKFLTWAGATGTLSGSLRIPPTPLPLRMLLAKEVMELFITVSWTTILMLPLRICSITGLFPSFSLLFFSIPLLHHHHLNSKIDNRRGQAEKEFKVEVEAIGRVRHKNLVRLLGYCAEGAHRYSFLFISQLPP